MAIGQELLNVPMGDMIRQMALAIADGQTKLDAASIEVAEMMGGLKVLYDEKGKLSFSDSRVFFGHEWMTLKEARAYLFADVVIDPAERDKYLEAIMAQAKREDGKEPADDTLVRVPTRLSMLELGFSPTFYQFVDTIIEVKIAIKITREFTSSVRRTSGSADVGRNEENRTSGLWGFIAGGTSGRSERTQVSTSQVDATYSSKYGYSAEGASLLRTKLAPVPPPPVLEERIRRAMEEDIDRRRRRMEALLPKPGPTP
jgi:hypothetical protein